MMSRKFILGFVFILVCFSIVAYAEEKQESDKNKTPKIESFTTDFTVEYFYGSGTLDLNVKADSSASTNPEFRSNPQAFNGIGLSYKDYGVALTGSLVGMNNSFTKDESIYGETKTLGFSFYYFSRKFGIDFFYKNYKSFYRTENTQIYPDLKIINAGLNATYVFSDDFSFKAAFKMSERQKRSAATWLASVGVGFSEISNSGPLIPNDVKSRFTEDSDFEKGKFYSISAAAGGAFTLTSNGYYFLTGSLMLGLSPQLQNQDGDKSIHIGLKSNVKLALGYNGDRYYFGVNLQADGVALRLKAAEMTVMNIDAQISVGHRFDL